MDVHSHLTGVPLDHLWFVSYIALDCVSQRPLSILRFTWMSLGLDSVLFVLECFPWLYLFNVIFYMEGVPPHSMCGLMLRETIHTADAWGNPFPNSRVLDSRVVSSFQLL